MQPNPFVTRHFCSERLARHFNQRRALMLVRILFSVVIVGTLLTGAACAQQRAPTPQEINSIESLVTKAAALVESKGKKAAFAEFGKHDSEWWHNDTYLFAYDMNGNVL